MYIALVIKSEDTLNREENSGNHEPGDTINNSRKHNLNSHQPDTRPPVSFDPRTVTILPFLVAQLASNPSLSKPSRKIKLFQNFSRSIYPPYLKASGSSRWKINDPWVGEGSWKFQGRKFVSFTLGEKGCSPRLREKSVPPLVVRDASTLWDGFPSDRCQGMQVTSTPSESNERTIAVVFENKENGGTNDWKNCRLIASLRGKKRKGCRRRDR